MKRREFVMLAATVVSAPALLASRAAQAASPIAATLYKNPSCTCCEGYAQYLEKNGFKVTVKPTNDLAEISQKAGVPENLEGCHTMFVGGYVVDGHVPVDIIRKLLAEKPAIAGHQLAWHAIWLSRNDRLEDRDLDRLCHHQRRQDAKSFRDCLRRFGNANRNDNFQFARFDQRADALQMAGPQEIVAWRFCVGADRRGARLAMEFSGCARRGPVVGQRGAVPRNVRGWSLHAPHVQQPPMCGTKRHFTKLVTSTEDLK